MIDEPHGQVRQSIVYAARGAVARSAGDVRDRSDEFGARLSTDSPSDAGSAAASPRGDRGRKNTDSLPIHAPDNPGRPGTSSAVEFEFRNPAGPDSGPRRGACAALPPRRIAARASLGE